MIEPRETIDGDQALPWPAKSLVRLPWPAKRWLAEHPAAWRYYTAVCRRAGWSGARLGWFTPNNGPLAGVRMRAIHSNHLWVPVGVYEPTVGRIVTSALQELRGRAGGVEVWDVGGHRGLFSMLCARNGADRVIAFEPSASNIVAFREHLSANPSLAARVDIVHAAVADRDGEIEFLVNEQDGAVNQIQANGVEGYDHGTAPSVQKVPVLQLDTWRAARASAPSILKVDVEGAEALVLRGAARVLATDRPLVLMEVHHAAAARAALAQLADARYRCWRIEAGGRLAPASRDAYGHDIAEPEFVLARPE
jgi:FkbM family methyltransferase